MPFDRSIAALACAGALLAMAASSGAQEHVERIEFVSATVKLPGQSSVSGMALRARLDGGWLGPNAWLVPAIEYWNDSDRFPEFGIEKATQRDWIVGADVRYAFDIGKSWRPYAGAGLQLHALRSTLDRADLAEVANGWTKPGLSILGGVDLPAASIVRSSIEVGYYFVSDFSQFRIHWGFGVKL